MTWNGFNKDTPLGTIARALGGIAIVGIALAASGCSASSLTIGGHGGKRLADLDLSGKAPDEIALYGPDTVRITQGDRLTITVDGDPDVKDRLRFTLSDGKLGIGREDWKFGESSGTATVSVTVPAARKLVLAGSGSMAIDALRGDETGVAIAGSGGVEVAAIDTALLRVEVMGSGTLKGAGRAQSLKLTVAGSGDADLAGVSAGAATVDVAGSGDARFASDGEVKATIMGSGEVRVKGRATCKVTSMGSGRLVCEP